MTNEKQELLERELLSILMLKPEIGIDLLQIKPKYLQNKINSHLLSSMLAVYEKFGVIDYANVVAHDNSISLSILMEVISDEYVPIIDVRKQFMACQISILNNYKKIVISNLSKKLNENKINCDDYLKKMEKINEVNIKFDTNEITEDELLENISTENIGIELKAYPKLNNMLKLVQGDFLMIGAPTSTGKSGLLLNLMNELMNNYQCIYFNMEMSKSTIYKRIIAIKSAVPVNYIEKPQTDYQAELVNKAVREISESKLVIEHKATYLQEIKSVLKIMKNDGKHTILFLDHIGLIKISGYKSPYEQMTEVAKQLRQICLDYDCTIIAACQLNRASYNANELNLSMLKDSGELENSSSKVILLYRDKDCSKDSLEPTMILDIVKNRDGQLGKINYKYYKTQQIFEEVKNYE